MQAMVAQNPELWGNQGFSGEIAVNQDEGGIGWMGSEDCLNGIKDNQYGSFGDSGHELIGEDSLRNSFYDCSELDESMHCYLIKGLLGEAELREDTVLGLQMADGEKSMRALVGDSPGNNLNNGVRGADVMDLKINCDMDGVHEDSVVHYDTIISNLETNVDAFMSKQQTESSNCYARNDSDVSSNFVSSSGICSMQEGGSNNNLESPIRSILSPVANMHMPPPLLSGTPLTPFKEHSVSLPSVFQGTPLQRGAGQSCGSNASCELDNSQKKMRMIDPEDCIKMGILDTDIQESEFGLIPNQTVINEYDFNNINCDGLNVDRMGKGVVDAFNSGSYTAASGGCSTYSQGSYYHSSNNQVTELDSSKGRRWSNNSTTSTISSDFPTLNLNGVGNNSSGQIIGVSGKDVLESSMGVDAGSGGALGLCGSNVVKKEQLEEVGSYCRNISELIGGSKMAVVCSKGVSSAKDMGNANGVEIITATEANCNSLNKHKSIASSIQFGDIDRNINNEFSVSNCDGLNGSNFDVALMEEDHYQTDGNMENEFYLTANSYLTEDEKLKLRRRGRRRRPGKCACFCL
ncbi:hypothetical protein FG386_001987 [Cryptosporidium ryanae]|uniref:uncharacterized protein n=1 Tax=Cryptosporidium ryanae TaxID=515981 RepID=UPI00351A2306|nr:hypothetical protein FG386_001987 [Cryptosporidium ryanae]